MRENQERNLAVLGTLALLPFLIYVYWNQLVSFFDPQEFITFLNPLKAGTPLDSYLYDGYRWVRDGRLIGFFRPAASLAYLAEYQLFHGEPAGYKAFNLFYHLLTCAALAAVFRAIGRGRGVGALFPALVFAFHPGAYGAVMWICARPDILAALFSLLAVASVLKLAGESGPSRARLLPALFALLASFSKEVGIANLVTLPVLYFFWEPGKRNHSNTRFLIGSLLGVAAIFVVVRLFLFHGNIGGYPVYAPVQQLHNRMLGLFVQVSGGFFIPWRALRLLLYGVIPAALAFYGFRYRKEGVRRIAVAMLVTGMYGFQSLLGNPELHYSYITSCFTVVFAAYFVSRLMLPRLVNAGLTLLLVVLLGFGSRHLSFSLARQSQAVENIYSGLGRISREMEAHQGGIIGVFVSDASREDLEIKHIPLFMDFLAPGRYTFEFLPDREYSGPVIYLEGDSLVLSE